MPKAVALVSGGLDSMLAVRVIQEQGLHVEGLNFFTGFCVEGHTHAIRKRARPKRNNALWVAERLGLKLHLIDVVEDYRDIVLNPKYGYGANLNPCLDCKIFMVRRALQWMREHEFDFIITGEVIGQRPKSQRKDTLPVVQQDSGACDRLLRPLCAKRLPPTLPERAGWVERERLLDFSGRNRKPQIALARKYGLDDYAQPAGGCCFLTDPQYTARLTDLWNNRGERAYELDDIMLLKVGRHIRPSPGFKVIIAREEGEGRFLSGYRKRFVSLRTLSHKGPEALIDGVATDGDIELAARLVARYGQGRGGESVRLEVRNPTGSTRELAVRPLTPGDPQGMDAGGPVTLDCRGLLCPLPVIRVQDRIADLAPGTRLRAICTDPGALQDIPAWCRINGHAVLETGDKNHEYLVTLRVGPTR